MKSVIRHYLTFFVSIYLVAKLVPGVSYSNNIIVLAEASLVLALVQLLVKPIISLITLPINILTLGLFSFVVNGFILYLVTLMLPAFRVTGFNFVGFRLLSLSLDSFYVSAVFSFIIVAFLISFIRGLINSLCSK